MIIEFEGHKGAKIKIDEASFGQAKKLKRVIANVFKNSGIKFADIDFDIESLKSLDPKSLVGALDSIIKIILELEASEEVEKVIFECLSRCTYNDRKITEELFQESSDYWGDYYNIVIQCLKVNLAPFLPPQVLKLLTLSQKEIISKPQKSE